MWTNGTLVKPRSSK